jgi:iron(III) transport system permease protein
VIVSRLDARLPLLGAVGLIVLAACLAPLLFPMLELAAEPISFDSLAQSAIWGLLGRTVVLTAGIVLLALSIGLPLAFLLARTDIAGRVAVLLLHAFPMFLPPLLPALGWFYLFGRNGLLGGPASDMLLFGDGGAVLVLGFAYAPIVTGLTALALWNADPALEEAARTVAPPLRVARAISLPAARPAIALAAIIVAALALSEAGVPTFLRVRTYAAAIFARLGGVDYAPGEAALLTLPVLAVTVLLFAAERMAIQGRSFAVMGLRSARADPIPLGVARLPASILCWTIALISFAPIAALAWRAGLEGFAHLPPWIGSGVTDSLFPAAAAATLGALIAAVIGHGLARGDRLAAGFDGIAFLAFVSPGVLIGIGLIALFNRSATQWVYASWMIVALGYLGRYAAIAIRAFAVSCAQAPARIEEAARVFGAGYWRRLTRIVVALNWRGLLGAWLLMIVFALRDLEMAALYYQPGHAPLAVRIFTLEANGPEPVVAALACVSAGITAIILALALPLLAARKSR